MITIFTRKELTVTFDMKRQGEVRDILSSNGIKHTVKVVNRQSASSFGRGRAEMASEKANQLSSCEYIIYVHKNDYDSALALIR